MLNIQNLVHHPPEAALERYLLNQSSELETEAVETHFLACSPCIERLEDIGLQISAIRLGLQELHLEKVALSFSKQGRPRIRWFSFHGVSSLVAAAAVVLAIALPYEHLPGEKPVLKLELTAYRGLDRSLLPTDQKVHLTLNASGLATGPIKVTLVNSEGEEVWDTLSENRDTHVSIDIPPVHTRGIHFFRLYSTGQNPELMREFGVAFEPDGRARSFPR